MRKILPLLIVLFILPFTGFAEEVLVEGYGYYLDIPEGWQLIDAKDTAAVSFADPTRTAVFQVLAFPGNRFGTAGESARYVRERFGAAGDEAPFRYQHRDAVLADYTFKAGKHEARGYFVFIEGEENDYVLLAFSASKSYEVFHDRLLSCLDSFAPGEESRSGPGPISQFYHSAEKSEKKEATLSFRGLSLPFLYGDGEIDANQTVIEREARILAGTKDKFTEAWQRYYRVIYRDTFQRLGHLSTTLRRALETAKVPREDAPRALLSWLQDFSYSRTGGISDFQSPLSCMVTLAGDCDSLGMAYVILLRRLGFDAILMVSTKYSHAMVGVDIPGPGARYTYEEKAYLVAELTAKVDIGLIDQNMADPAFWVPVAFGGPVK
jgi:hypothetical protein